MSARSATRLRGVPCESQASGAVPTMVAMTPLPATRRHGTPRESNSAHTASAVHAMSLIHISIENDLLERTSDEDEALIKLSSKGCLRYRQAFEQIAAARP